MGKDLSISVAMCTYNGERFLREQLDSLASQTRFPDEVVICDDGSVDHTLEILEQWKNQVPFEVNIFRNEKNLGFAKNFEKAMNLCTGDVVFLSDQDDCWLPEKLETVASVFQSRSEVLAVFHDAEVVDGSGEPMGFLREKMARYYLCWAEPSYLSPNIWRYRETAGCCMAFRRQILEWVFPLPEKMQHDMWLYYTIPAMGEMVYLRKVLMNYRVHGGNTSLSDSVGKKQTLAQKWRAFYNYEQSRYVLYQEFQPLIETLRGHLERFPAGKRRDNLLRWLTGNDRHYRNKERIGRNFFLFFPLWFLEIGTLRYFQHAWPISSMLYDMFCGLRNGWSVRGWNLLTKKFAVKDKK